jgi:hypothetical protein
MTVHIPGQLKEWRFVLVKAGDKAAFEQGLPSYTINDPKLAEWLKRGGNYGVLAGENHAIIDTDDVECMQLVREKLPPTFTVKSPGSNGLHFYYNYTGAPKTIPILDKTRLAEKQNRGHVKVGPGYCIGPYSVHPNGKLYLIANVAPFAAVTEQQIRETFAPFLAEKSKVAFHRQKEYTDDLEFSILQILNTAQLTRRGSSFQGPHPVHGSTTGTNFHVDPDTNLWYCFRCCGGGGSLQLLAVQEGIIQCGESLRGEQFRHTVAKEVERGLIKQPKPRDSREKKEKEEVREYPWKPNTQTIECKDEGALYYALIDWLKRYVDLKRPEFYHVIAAWIMHTWLIEDWRVSGPLYILGTINTGKTTILEVLEETAYRGVRGGSMSNATMFRLSHAYGPALLLDEAQLYNREEWAETQAFLNERYRRGGKVWRMEGDGKNMVPKYFNAFGATAFAGSYPPWPALASRALTIKTEKNTRRVEQTLTREFENEGQQFRNLLQGFREKRLGHNPERMPELDKVKDYRTREIGHALLAVAPNGEPREQILSYLGVLETEHQTDEETGSESDYVRALNLCQPTNGAVTAKEVRAQLAEVLGEVEYRVVKGTLDQEEPKRIVNEAALPKSRTIMGVLTTLGFKKTRVGHRGGLTGILWDRELLTRLNERYGISSVSSGTSGTSTKAREDDEDPEDNPIGSSG